MGSIDVRLYETIKVSGINIIMSVPCIMLKGLLKVIDQRNEIEHIPVTREEEGIGIAAGAYLGGRFPAILIQNSGLGNSINAIKSLLELYKIPVVLIMSHRGTEEDNIIAQYPMGQITLKLLKCIDIKYYVIETSEKINQIEKLVKKSQISKKSIALILTRSLWGR
ncbi:MAG: sulfopyruvate decarboxylase subunit alpha [Promethearchaeota archaeon]